MNKKETAEMEAWLRTPESDEPVPDFVERELEEPFDIDLSDWAEVELSPDFTDRVVRALAKKRAEAAAAEHPAPASIGNGAPVKGGTAALKPVPLAGPPAKKTPEEPPRPSLAAARPSRPRAAASRR
jgi:hypothetical protein